MLAEIFGSVQNCAGGSISRTPCVAFAAARSTSLTCRVRVSSPRSGQNPALEAERAQLREELLHEIGPNTSFSGSLLRKVRESLGVDLEEIARYTKISQVQLHAIEEENFGELPASVYLRGFIHEIAKFLKLDPTQVTRSYLRRHGQWRTETKQQDPA